MKSVKIKTTKIKPTAKAKKVPATPRRKFNGNVSNKVRPWFFILLFACIGTAYIYFANAATVINVTNDTELTAAFQSVAGGDTIVLQPGTYGIHYLPKPYASTVTIKGADGHRDDVRVGGFKTYANPGPSTLAANITITNLTITGINSGSDGAVRINKGSHDIKLEQVTINGGVRNIVINAYPYDESQGVVWPYNITIANSDLSNSGGDNIQVTGARDLVIRNNYIHHPKDIPTDHVDGIQLIASDKVYIIGNTFRDQAVGTVGPNQAIMIGRSEPFVSYLKVTNTYVANNLIHMWRGSGIIVAGTTSTYVVNNTVVDLINNGGAFYTTVKDSASKGGSASDWYNHELYVWNNIFSKTNITRAGQATTFYPKFESNNFITADQTATLGTNLLVGDPIFVSTDPTSPDLYKLQSGSRAVNSAITYGTAPYNTPAYDLNNFTRDSLIDRGAREYAGAIVTPPIPPTQSDITAPQLTISKPVAGTTVTKSVSVLASATDNIAVAKLELYKNNQKMYETSTPSLSYKINLTKDKGTIFVITIKAYDVSGNMSEKSVTLYK